MKTHKEQFWDVIKKINEAEINYVVIRGFLRLPDSADNDIDLVPHYEEFDKCLAIIKQDMDCHWVREYGFAEYAFMKNCSYKTYGPDDHSIAERRFYIDSNSSLFFSSPYHNYQTSWVVSHSFNEYVYETKIKKEFKEGFVWIPSPECEITLQVLRNVLDNKGQWKPKSKQRVFDLIDSVDEDLLTKSTSLVLPCAHEITKSLKNRDLLSVNKYSLGGL